MGILSWIIFGILAGGAAGIITGNERSGCLYNMLVGVSGAFLGGFLMQYLTGETFAIGFNLPSFIVAVIGSIILLAISGVARSSKRR